MDCPFPIRVSRDTRRRLSSSTSTYIAPTTLGRETVLELSSNSANRTVGTDLLPATVIHFTDIQDNWSSDVRQVFLDPGRMLVLCHLSPKDRNGWKKTEKTGKGDDVV